MSAERSRGINPDPTAAEMLWDFGKPWWSDYDTERLLSVWIDVVRVVGAAEKYREVGLADPTSLDLPPAGSDLDRRILQLREALAR